jgi:hypothetical protein
MNKLVLKKSIMLDCACYYGTAQIERIFGERQTLTVTEKMLPAIADVVWRDFYPYGLAWRLANHVCKSRGPRPRFWVGANAAYDAWAELLDTDGSIITLIEQPVDDAEACTHALRVMFAFFCEYAKD